MLDALLKVAGRTEPGFSRKIIKWAITCTANGQFTGVIPLAETRGREYQYCPNLNQPELVAGGEKRSHFLAEGLRTIALYWEDGKKQKNQEKYRGKHKYFCGLLESASQDAPYLKAAAKMLKDEEAIIVIHADLKRQKAKPTENATVMVDGINPLERDDWKEWWRKFRLTLYTPKKTTVKMRCFATGELVEPLMTHPKIKGLAGVGGLGTGDVLIGFDKDASQSYGLEQSANAAVSEDAATAYAETLSGLLRDKGIKLGGAMVTYWFLGSIPDEDDPFSWLTEPPDQISAVAELKANQLLKAIKEGRRPDLAGNRYIALVLSGAAGRVMVREIMEGAFESLVANIEKWFSDLAIVSREGNRSSPFPKFSSVAEDNVPPPLISSLWRAALTGGMIPTSAMSRTLMRIRADFVADRSPLEIRFSIIKAYLKRKGDQNMEAYLNKEHPHPAYHCGRLLAVLARLQRTALGDVGSGVVQRYYAAASQTPGLILGKLTTNAKNHLGKLEGGLAWWYENLIAEVISRIRNDVPRTLTLEEQSLFALGYYQQLAALKAGKGDKLENITDNNKE